MKELLLNEFEELAFRRDFLVLVTRDFSGHRLDWLENLDSRSRASGKSILVLCEDVARLKLENVPNLSEVYIFETQDVLSFAESFFGDKSEKKVIFWDADDKLFQLFNSKMKARLLIMRPYATEYRMRSLLVFVLKFCLLIYFKYIKKWDIGLLGIPRSSHKFFKQNWIDDELLLLNTVVTTNQISKVSQDVKILIPGYISKRKNPLLAISACAILRKDYGIPIRLIFRGEIDPDISMEIQSLHLDWVELNDYYCPRDLYLQSLLESDLVLLPYTNRGSSGVVLESLSLGVPVAIRRNRHWKNLCGYSGGLLFMMREGESGIIDSVLTLLARETVFLNVDGLITRKSALDFLMSG